MTFNICQIRRIHLDKPYPTCPEITSDWAFIKNMCIKQVKDTKFIVDTKALLEGPLQSYAKDERIPILIKH